MYIHDSYLSKWQEYETATTQRILTARVNIVGTYKPLYNQLTITQYLQCEKRYLTTTTKLSNRDRHNYYIPSSLIENHMVYRFYLYLSHTFINSEEAS